MRTVPATPPAKMVFPLALEYARRGFYIRPLSWDGSEGGHALAWLHYPAGFPLAYLVDAENPAPGRPWKAGDLTRADWFAWWTCLAPDCFEPDANGDTPACVCDAGDVNFLWSFTAFDDDATAFDELTNPNDVQGLRECGNTCDCATSSAGGSSTGGGTSTVGSGTASGSGVTAGAATSPRPGYPGTPGGSSNSGGSGSPTPSGSLGGGGGSGGGGGGSGVDRDKKRRRRGDAGDVGPTITLTPLLTDPEGCQLGTDPINHTWSIGVALSSGAGVADGIYSVQLRVLGEMVGSWMLSPGGTAAAEYSVTIAPDAAHRTAICTGAAFGGGPACIPGEAELEPSGICGSTTSTPPSSSSSIPPSSSSTPPSSSSSIPPSSSSGPGLNPISLAYDATSGNAPGACAVWPTASTYYMDTVAIGYGSWLYTDSGGTTAAPDGYYSDGTNYWQVGSGSVSAGPTLC